MQVTRSHLVTEVDGARLGVVGRGGGVAEGRQERPRGVEPRAARERDGRPTALPVRECALRGAAGERSEVVAGVSAERVTTGEKTRLAAAVLGPPAGSPATTAAGGACSCSCLVKQSASAVRPAALDVRTVFPDLRRFRVMAKLNT